MKLRTLYDHVWPLALYGLVGFTPLALSAAEPQKEVHIVHHEAAQSLRFTPMSTTAKASGPDAIVGHLSFTAFDQQFDLALQANDRLLEDLPADQKTRITASHQLYKGYIEGLTVESFRPSRPIWKTQNFQVIENKCLMEMGGKAG